MRGHEETSAGFISNCLNPVTQTFTELVTEMFKLKTDTCPTSKLPSPPGEREFVEEVVAPRQETLLHDVPLDGHPVALILDVHLDTVQQVLDGRSRPPGTKSYH